jgi:futalosine hydrolase
VIALLCSVSLEADFLLFSLEKSGALDMGSKTLIRGHLAGNEVVLCAGGLGKANAAHAATLLITRFDPEALVIFGVGGAYPSSSAKLLDLALASEEIAGDEGVLTAGGFRDTTEIGIPLVQTGRKVLHNRFPAAPDLLEKASKGLSGHGLTGTVHTGAFVTLSTCTGTVERARELETLYGALCENMEGAAAAQVAELHQLPWLELRAVSNRVEERNLEKWDIPNAARKVQQAVRLIVERWK